MQSLLLIRHGEAEHLVNDVTGGWTDTSLTELGRRQAALLAGRLKVELAGVPARLYTSDLLRASQTAEIVGQELGLPITLAPGLREINNGLAAGKTHEEARRIAIPPSEPILDWQPYPQAETWRQFFLRVAGFMDSLPVEEGTLPILSTHGGTIVQVVVWWLQLDMETMIHVWFDIAPAGITVLRLNKWGDRTIERLSDSAHLYAEGLAERIVLDNR